MLKEFYCHIKGPRVCIDDVVRNKNQIKWTITH